LSLSFALAGVDHKHGLRVKLDEQSHLATGDAIAEVSKVSFFVAFWRLDVAADLGFADGMFRHHNSTAMAADRGQSSDLRFVFSNMHEE